MSEISVMGTELSLQLTLMEQINEHNITYILFPRRNYVIADLS